MKKVRTHWLRELGLSFWLPLPLLALIFWLSSCLMTDQVLSRSYDAQDRLPSSTHLEVRLSADVLEIKGVIDREQGVTKVEVQTTESNLKQLKFVFLTTDTTEIESQISQELGLARENIRQLARYEILD